MKLAAIFLLGVSCCGLALDLAGLLHVPRPGRWSVEVLRTTDARGMTYSSLHSAQGEPDTGGASMRWVDDQGRRWIYVEGALAHELSESTKE